MSAKSLTSLKTSTVFGNEPEVETFAVKSLSEAGYTLTMRSCKSTLLDKHWPSKAKRIAKSSPKGKASKGYPDILLYLGNDEKPICVWENKGPGIAVNIALDEAKFYIEGLRKSLPNEPALPSIAAGYNGKELRIAFFNNEETWVSIKHDGSELVDSFPNAKHLASGINSQGVFTARSGAATASDLRGLLPKLKTVYRNIPILSSGRVPVDFTVALLTMKLIVEQNRDWGAWGEMLRLAPGSKSPDHAVGERLQTLTQRVLSDPALSEKYGSIFTFHEKGDVLETTFAFGEVLSKIPKGKGSFIKVYELLDNAPPLEGADFDIFGEVYQGIGDEATKKTLGEFFTGRHIISGVLPILAARAGIDKSFESVENKKIGDISCGTGGFLTEFLRFVRQTHEIDDDQIKSFSAKAFFGYDLNPANASRARVNMYFAGDGFSRMEGSFDSLSSEAQKAFPANGFDIIATNPPYGKGSGGRKEDAFLLQNLSCLKKGTGWACVVMPTGVMENPRSQKTRFNLINNAVITDVISLPKHAFAPYTQQRTAIVIFQRRKSNLVSEAGSWKQLLEKCGDEKIRMFIVDNDGYANSDKRYETNRKTVAGEWLHNDLAPWISSKGEKRKSKLYSALIDNKSPVSVIDEKGNTLADKFGEFRFSELYSVERGVTLLPDAPLRAAVRALKLDDWEKRVAACVSFGKGSDILLPLPFREEVEFLLDHVIDLSEYETSERRISTRFDIIKGNQGLTEAMIYRSLDLSKGIPVYGGGASVPRFKASKDLTRSNNNKATVFLAPAIVVSMDGSSGNVTYVKSGEFFCNHHGAVLKPKRKRLNLSCFAQMAEPHLKRLASNKGASATLTGPALAALRVTMPSSKVVTLRIAGGRNSLVRLSRLFR